jgi:hypothetical protein
MASVVALLGNTPLGAANVLQHLTYGRHSADITYILNMLASTLSQLRGEAGCSMPYLAANLDPFVSPGLRSRITLATCYIAYDASFHGYGIFITHNVFYLRFRLANRTLAVVGDKIR